MKWLKGIIDRFLSSIGLLNNSLYRIKNVDDWPDKPQPLIVYLQGQSGHEWLAGLLCPCGCKNLIELVLLKGEGPSWKIVKHSNRNVSIQPSVNRSVGCRSHFFLKDSKIIWCN